MSKLNELISLCKCSISITVNMHKDYYQTVEEYLKDLEIDEIELDVFNKMIESDSIIEIQAYPTTPIGSYSVYHFDLDFAIEKMIKIIKNEQ